MATIDNIAQLLMQQEALDRKMMPSGEATNTEEGESARESRKLASFPNVMREAFRAASQMRRRATDAR
jgi:hypothetical protein